MVIEHMGIVFVFFFSSRRRHTRCSRDWSSDVCSSDLHFPPRRKVASKRLASGPWRSLRLERCISYVFYFLRIVRRVSASGFCLSREDPQSLECGFGSEILKNCAVIWSLLACENEVVEKSDAVCFRPNADATGVAKSLVLDFEQLFAVEVHGEEFAGEFDAQRAPFTARHLRVNAVAEHSAFHGEG